MGYVATGMERDDFHYLYRELWKIIGEYERGNGVKLYGSVFN